MPGIVVGRIVGVIVEDEHFGSFGNSGIERVGVKLAEARGEVAVLDRRDVLILEEDHLVGEERGADLRDRFVGQMLRQVDAFDHCADGGGKYSRRDFRHVVLVSAAVCAQTIVRQRDRMETGDVMRAAISLLTVLIFLLFWKYGII